MQDTKMVLSYWFFVLDKENQFTVFSQLQGPIAIHAFSKTPQLATFKLNFILK